MTKLRKDVLNFYANKDINPEKGDLVETPSGQKHILESPARHSEEFNQIGLSNYRTNELILIKRF